jgi:hypothetical protein
MLSGPRSNLSAEHLEFAQLAGSSASIRSAFAENGLQVTKVLHHLYQSAWLDCWSELGRDDVQFDLSRSGEQANKLAHA